MIDFEDFHRYLSSLRSTTERQESASMRAQHAILTLLIESLPDFQEVLTDE